MNKPTTKKTIAATLILSSLILSSCGIQKSNDTAAVYKGSQSIDAVKSSNTANYSDEAANYYDEEEYYYNSDLTNEVEAAEDNSSELPDYNNTGDESISKEMLVYKCSMSIDVLEYQKSIEEYKKLTEKYNGFIECENFSDGGSSSKWIYENTEKFSTYNATVRIPSKDYNNFCSDLEKIGDLRNKTASVDNLSQEYSDLNTTLKVYEAKEKRYIDLLSTIKEDQYAIEVERELTSIQTEIAKIKTRMKSIKDDVAYSYIDVRISEVKEYTEHVEPPKTKTFVDRLKNTVTDTIYGFLNFLEDLLFFLIEILPYILIFGILFIILKKILKALKKKSAIKKEKKKSSSDSIDKTKENDQEKTEDTEVSDKSENK